MKRLAVALLALAAVWAQAGEGALRQVGEGHLRVLFWPVYNSRLYTADGAYREQQRPIRLEIEYLRAIAAEDLVARTREEWAFQGLLHPEQEEWLARLAVLWPDVDDGDVLALEVDRQGVSRFYCNGELLGTIADPDFGRAFLAIWLSPGTSRPDLRQALLGQR